MSNYRGYRDLKVYQDAYALAMEIFRTAKGFPAEERRTLTDQIVRSSRSVAANIAEGWKKRRYVKMFISKMIDAAGEAGETEVWLDVAMDCGYITEGQHRDFTFRCDRLCAMLYSIVNQPEKFCQ